MTYITVLTNNQVRVNMLSISVYLLLFLTASVYFYFKYSFKYWEKRGVATLNPLTPAGDYWKSFISYKHEHVILHDCYKIFKSRGLEYGGLYYVRQPIFLAVGLDMIKRVLQSDYEYFSDRGVYCNKEEQPLSANLLSMKGERWKSLRGKLSPTFAPGKLKIMFPTIVKYSKELVEVIKLRNGAAVNVNNFFKSYTVDTILDCLLGLEEHVMNNTHSLYMNMGEKMTECSLRDYLKVVWSKGTKKPLNLSKSLFIDQELFPFFKKLVLDIKSYRMDKNVIRNDFFDSLLKIMQDHKMKAESDPLHPFDLNDVVAQVAFFFAAGFKTSTFLLAGCVYELAKHQHIQEKLRKEITTAMEANNNELNYPMVKDLKYLEQVMTEALRIHNPGARLNRVCVKDYKLPGSNITIEKGTLVMISVMGLHNDPEYFPDPEKFDPDRFSDNGNIPYTLGFGAGPKNCPGQRLGEMQVKLALISMLSNFRVTVNEKTDPQPIFDNVSRHVVMQYKNPFWINFEPLC